MTRSYGIFLLSFEDLNRGLIELKVIVVAISMNIGGNRRNRLIFIQINEMFDYFGLITGS
jgi:hypothetical protein